MKRRTIAPIAALAASGLILAGCGNGDDPDTGTTGGTNGDDTVAAGCEDYAQYGTFSGETVEVYATIQG